jgi:hypothetical protein
MSKVKKRPATWPEFGDSIVKDCERAHNNHMTYPEFADSILQALERSHKSGNPKAWWDIVVFCEQNNWPKPAWVREKLVEHAWKQATTTEKKGGRPHEYARNLYIFREVEICRRLGHYYNCEPDGSAKKYKCFKEILKPLSSDRVRRLTKKDGSFFKGVAVEMIREDLEEQEEEKTTEAVEKAYSQGKRLWEKLRNSGSFEGPISVKFYSLLGNPILEKNILSLQKQAASNGFRGFPLPDDVAGDLASVFKSNQFANVLKRLRILTPQGESVSRQIARRVVNEHFKPVEPFEDRYPT